VVPLIVILLILVYFILRSTASKDRVRSGLDFHSAFLGLFQSWVSSSALVAFIRVVVGSLRPDFLAICMADTSGNCTGDEATVLDARLSFPSLHSSMCASGLGFLSLCIAGKLKPYHGGEGYYWKMPLILAPSILALFVGLTRVVDNKHHPVDVFFGFLIGTLFAWGAYGLHYPAVSDRHAGVPLYIIKYKEEDEGDDKKEGAGANKQIEVKSDA